MSLVGILVAIGLGVLVGWRLISKWLVFRRIKRYGILIEAQVTDVRQETRLVTQLGGAGSTSQKLKYENFLYARWYDPLTQENFTFRIKVPDFSQFQIGETIPIRMNRENPNEYRINYSKPSRRPVPHLDNAYHDYQQGYKPVDDEVQDVSIKREYEAPEVAYPQQDLPPQQEFQES